MIAHLSGKILFHKDGLVILDVSGVGYKINIANKKELQDGKQANYFIHQHLREDSSDLYGFDSYEELSLFEQLISVNGVGPKVGMLIMSSAEVNKIVRAILNEDLTFFQSISGIGKKVAARIILDLKSKITGIDSEGIFGNLNDSSNEVLDALQSLGYKNTEIMKLFPKMPVECSTAEAKIKWLIKNISK
ncbi:MAG: Holliday junction branch migration protein RuvA [Patescibacteria group bacterium]|nr:Holliday junction branch migration protein RuvA [Patescibacteria group bacterium]